MLCIMTVKFKKKIEMNSTRIVNEFSFIPAVIIRFSISTGNSIFSTFKGTNELKHTLISIHTSVDTCY